MEKSFRGMQRRYMIANALESPKGYPYPSRGVPYGHTLNIDLANKRLRLFGKNSDDKWHDFENF